ncbi:hypothetical protein VT47_08395 [Pseudomonas syringae pv. syringae]|uniref:hypothetical protein n=1 Tax=Pseudomonas syringae TaxID=317 RepID=UPI0007AE9A3B|nr:hypothetical protein [Pseudomonas syringae]KZL40023.1 hypothetical protein VT47_08395 [Pseudomonas syringae pv. syringae]
MQQALHVHPPLYANTAELHAAAPEAARSHADVIRTFNRALADLTAAGALTERNKREWYFGKDRVALFGSYNDSSGRDQTCLYFGSWLCLAMILKVTRLETRQALTAILKKDLPSSD